MPLLFYFQPLPADLGALRPKGFRGILSPCPQGLSRSDLGLEEDSKELVALCYSDKVVCLEGGATDQSTVDVLLREELLGV